MLSNLRIDINTLQYIHYDNICILVLVPRVDSHK